MTFKVTEDGARRALEAARRAGLKVDDAARAFVAEGESADFYLGYLSGIACAVTHSRSFLKKLGEAVDSDSRIDAEGTSSLHLIADAVEQITMRVAAPAIAAAARWDSLIDRTDV